MDQVRIDAWSLWVEFYLFSHNYEVQFVNVVAVAVVFFFLFLFKTQSNFQEHKRA